MGDSAHVWLFRRFRLYRAEIPLKSACVLLATGAKLVPTRGDCLHRQARHLTAYSALDMLVTRRDPTWTTQLAIVLRPVCVVLAMVLLSAAARADDASWTLDWDAPWSCPSERAVRKTVHAWLERAVERKNTRGIRVQASVRKETSGFTLDLRLATAGSSGRELLRAAKCETLVGVVALKVALLAAPGALFDTTELRRDRSDESWGLAVATALGMGSLPGLGPFLELSASRNFPYTALELGVGYGFGNVARYPAIRAGAKLDLFYLRPRFCARPHLPGIELRICGGVEVGLLRGQGFGPELSDTFEARRPHGLVSLGAAVRWPETGLMAAWIAADALISVVRSSFYVRDLERLYAPDRFGARVQVGVACRFQ